MWFSAHWLDVAISSPRHLHAVSRRDRRQAGHLERRGRAHALPLRHLGLDEQPEAAAPRDVLGIAPHETRVRHTDHVRRPPLALVRREPRRERDGVAELAQHERVERHGEPRRLAAAPRHDLDRAIVRRLQRRRRRHRERKLQHERPAVVGDAAHHVEPPGSAGDEQRAARSRTASRARAIARSNRSASPERRSSSSVRTRITPAATARDGAARRSAPARPCGAARRSRSRSTRRRSRGRAARRAAHRSVP